LYIYFIYYKGKIFCQESKGRQKDQRTSKSERGFRVRERASNAGPHEGSICTVLQEHRIPHLFPLPSRGRVLTVEGTGTRSTNLRERSRTSSDASAVFNDDPSSLVRAHLLAIFPPCK